ncbi:MAG: ABC transporter ATP-binding protein [Gemmatimonadetes bacterium]|nr:ABC transporter ATP-binding protein [Gemmatimonadota bacterium]
MIETRALGKVYLGSGFARRRTPSGGVALPAGASPQWMSAAGAPRVSGPGAMAQTGGRMSPPRGMDIAALVALDLNIKEGEFFGLLGPNGAGKTTTIGILTTRVRATSGDAWVAGCHVSDNDVELRRRIGVVPQRPNPDRGLNVLENLVFHGAYFGLSTSEATRRAMDLLGKFDIADRVASSVDALSGGQQQRLMIARALLHEPQVLFLDEPTVGLDPQARLALWTILRQLHADGRTIVMTTHYMHEADELCDRLAIIDRGQLLACDTPEKLRAQAPGTTVVEIEVEGDAAAAAARCGAVPGVSSATVSGNSVRALSDRGGEAVPALIRAIEGAGARVTNMNLSSPSLETLFVSLTGRRLD